MKNGTLENPKFRRLMRRFRISAWQAVGLLQTLWMWTARNAPQGDIGRWTDEDIAEGIGWDCEPRELLDGLVETGWLDTCLDHRYIIHDWAEHAEKSVRTALSNKGLHFAKVNNSSNATTAFEHKDTENEKPEHSPDSETENRESDNKNRESGFNSGNPCHSLSLSLSHSHSLMEAGAKPEPFVPPDEKHSETVELGEAWAAFDVHWGFLERINSPVVQKPGREKFSLKAAPAWARVLDEAGSCTLSDVTAIFSPGGYLDSDQFEKKRWVDVAQDPTKLLVGKYGSQPGIIALVAKARAWRQSIETPPKPRAHSGGESLRSRLANARPPGLVLPDGYTTSADDERQQRELAAMQSEG